MKKILYIGKDVSRPKTGGEICSYNNRKILKNIFLEKYNIYALPDESKFQILLNKFFFLYPGLQIKVIKDIYEKIKELGPTYIFLETAQYGILAKKIKRKFPECKIISFFHNIEIEYAKSYFSLWRIKSWYFYFLTKLNETSSIEYSDYCFTINKKDAEKMLKIYKREADFIMPFSVENKISDEESRKLNENKERIHSKNCLFIGSNFFGNTDGLKWFIKNILPNVDVHLTIVGNGMSKDFCDNEKITVFDFVKDLSCFYKKTDFVILPIISGGGMKTKTADALMYGKSIIGTPNAFSGYDIKNLKGVYECETKDDFIFAIKKIYDDDIFTFNQEIHERFVLRHSISVTEKSTREFFLTLESEE